MQTLIIIIMLIPIPIILNLWGYCVGRENYSKAISNLADSRPKKTVHKIISTSLLCLKFFMGDHINSCLKKSGDTRALLLRYHWRYIEHLLIFYFLIAVPMALLTKPIEVESISRNSIFVAFGMLIWIGINITFDALSLQFTKYSLNNIVNGPKTSTNISKWIFIDVFVALSLFILTQLFVNGLYAVQIGKENLFFDYMFSFEVTLREYHFRSAENIKFPGHMIISLSTYLPTICIYIISLLLFILSITLKPIVVLVNKINVLDEKCGMVTPSVATVVYIAAIMKVIS